MTRPDWGALGPYISEGSQLSSVFVSYAQNFEDVMLWRALKDVEHGFYIDVGAYSPIEDSVTKAFYDRGWHGINIEPYAEYQRQLRLARPRDINLGIALGDRSGEITMTFVTATGLSTLCYNVAKARIREGRAVIRDRVQMRTLRSVWASHVPPDQPVHFLKVDVEGFEREVLLGNDWEANRPWITVVEATNPTTPDPSFQRWENILTSAAYSFVYTDGLNRFYVAEEHGELASAFESPPNVFDNFLRVVERDALERAARAEHELQALRATRSWRWTRGLRAIAVLARRSRAVIARVSRERR